MDLNKIIGEAEKLVGEHPDQARSGLDQAESLVDEQTGGKFGDQLKKGEEMLEGRLGLQDEAQPPAQQ